MVNVNMFGLVVLNGVASREKSNLDNRLKKAEEAAKHALNEAKEAKDEAKRLKKELDETTASLEKSKEQSQKVEARFRDVVSKLSGIFPLSIFVKISLPDNLESMC